MERIVERVAQPPAERPATTATRGVPLPAGLVGLMCLAAAGLVDLVIRHERGLSGDEPFYVQMATHPGRPHSFPYATRVAVPWLVHILPLSQGVSFQLITLLAIGVAGGALYALMREFGIESWLAAGLAVGFAVSPNLLVVLIRDGRSIDPATTLVMVLGTLFIVRHRLLALTVTIVIGVAVKETSLFLIPFAYAVWASRPLDRRAGRDVAMVAIAPIAVYLVLRLAIPAIGSQYTPGYGGPFLKARLDVFRQVFTGTELRRVAYAFGPLWLVAPYALRNLWFARRGLVLVGLCVAAMTVSYDAGRIIFLAAPVFYVAGAWVVNHRRRLAVLMVVALFAVDLAYAVYMQDYGVQHGIDGSPPSSIKVY